jgi:hypothetical protein
MPFVLPGFCEHTDDKRHELEYRAPFLPLEGVAKIVGCGLPHHKEAKKCKKLLSFAEKFYLRIFST